jgi:hypothetical protein
MLNIRLIGIRLFWWLFNLMGIRFFIISYPSHSTDENVLENVFIFCFHKFFIAFTVYNILVFGQLFTNWKTYQFHLLGGHFLRLFALNFSINFIQLIGFKPLLVRLKFKKTDYCEHLTVFTLCDQLTVWRNDR